MFILRPRSVHSTEYKLLAHQLHEARLAAGLTQRQVAARLNKPPSFVHKVENAEREVNVIELHDYCVALEKDFLEFVGELQRSLQQWRDTER